MGTYLKNILIGIDQLVNAICLGDPDEMGDSSLCLARGSSSRFNFINGIVGVTGDSLQIRDTTLGRDYIVLRDGKVLAGMTTANTSGASLQTKDGLTFPATQVASADPNTLDDYEEGMFTPTASGNSTSGVGTYTKQFGRYTKIGNRVFFNLVLGWSAHTGTGSVKITGLPFTANATAYNYSATAVYNDGLAVGAGNQLCAYVTVGSTQVDLLASDPSTGVVSTIPMDVVVNYMMLSGSYLV